MRPRQYRGGMLTRGAVLAPTGCAGIALVLTGWKFLAVHAHVRPHPLGTGFVLHSRGPRLAHGLRYGLQTTAGDAVFRLRPGPAPFDAAPRTVFHGRYVTGATTRDAAHRPRRSGGSSRASCRRWSGGSSVRTKSFGRNWPTSEPWSPVLLTSARRRHRHFGAWALT